MSPFIKRHIVVSLLLVFTASVILLYKTASRITVTPVDIFKLPLEFGEWKGKDIPMEEEVYQALQTQSVMLREYINSSGDSVVLTIVYYSGNRVELHLPERCSVGQGSDIEASGTDSVHIDGDMGDITVNKLLVKNPSGKQIILYHFQSGSFATASYFNLRLHMIMNKFKNIPNSGSLVKFSSGIKNNVNETTRILKKFINDIGQILPKCII